MYVKAPNEKQHGLCDKKKEKEERKPPSAVEGCNVHGLWYWGLGWDPTLQSLGCCDKDLDLNPVQWMLWKASQRGIRFLF